MISLPSRLALASFVVNKSDWPILNVTGDRRFVQLAPEFLFVLFITGKVPWNCATFHFFAASDHRVIVFSSQFLTESCLNNKLFHFPKLKLSPNTDAMQTESDLLLPVLPLQADVQGLLCFQSGAGAADLHLLPSDRNTHVTADNLTAGRAPIPSLNWNITRHSFLFFLTYLMFDLNERPSNYNQL